MTSTVAPQVIALVVTKIVVIVTFQESISDKNINSIDDIMGDRTRHHDNNDNGRRNSKRNKHSNSHEY